MIEPLLRIVVWALVALIVVVTLLPLSTSTAWWIRGWEFPRAQIAVVAVLVACAAVFLMSGWGLLAPLLLFACAAGQFSYIYKYTPLVPVEIAIDHEAPPDTVRMMALNVLLENDRYDEVRAVIRTEAPHVLILMEVDRIWTEALDDILAGYDFVLREPLDNYYGMIFATRLEMLGAEMVYLVDDETPTAFAELVAPNGKPFNFVGLHPRPPVPGVDTDERDAQIRKSATFARAADIPVVIMGDFNAVSWSRMSQAYKRYGEYLDPRVGRGFMSSFDANRPLLRFPIDQIYMTPGVALHNLRRGPYVGSDHFPMIADVSFPK